MVLEMSPLTGLDGLEGRVGYNYAAPTALMPGRGSTRLNDRDRPKATSESENWPFTFLHGFMDSL
jgi:hypothetical protein